MKQVISRLPELIASVSRRLVANKMPSPVIETALFNGRCSLFSCVRHIVSFSKFVYKAREDIEEKENPDEKTGEIRQIAHYKPCAVRFHSVPR